MHGQGLTNQLGRTERCSVGLGRGELPQPVCVRASLDARRSRGPKRSSGARGTLGPRLPGFDADRIRDALFSSLRLLMRSLWPFKKKTNQLGQVKIPEPSVSSGMHFPI